MPISPQHSELLATQLDSERRLVSFDSYDLSVRQIMDMFESGEIFIPPEYQRQFVWTHKRQSLLIESVFLGIPVPSLFMATNKDATWEVVDGVQRLCSLAHFIGSEKALSIINKRASLQIEGTEKLAALDGYSFNDLPKTLQLMLTTRPIRVTVLNDKSDLNVRFDLFERLNTGGVALTDQEIRNCVYRGSFNDAIKEMATHGHFETSVNLKPSDENNGTKEELVLRFLAYHDEYQLFEHSVKDFLNNYMKTRTNQQMTPQAIGLFDETFNFIRDQLPGGIARGNRRLTPLNLYEAVSVGVALAIEARGVQNIARGVLPAIVNDVELRRLTTGATNSRVRVTGRIHYVRDRLI